MMYESASETTLKTSSTPTGTDNTDYSQNPAKKEASANSAQREAQLIFTKITGRPGMAEVAGWHAHDAVSLHGMSVGQAIQAAIKRMNMWTWATQEALAKREAARASQKLVDRRWLAIYGATDA